MQSRSQKAEGRGQQPATTKRVTTARASLLSAFCLLLFATAAFAQTPAVPSADDLARRAIDSIAGPAWEKARYIEFSFVVEREGKVVANFPQRWDRYTGEYRVSGRDQKGNDFEAIINTNTRQGRAWLAGEEVKDTRLQETLTTAYRRFINDTYWLLMPLKMMDPGVHRTAEGSRTDSCGHTWDVVKLSFDQGIGLTPNDVYWAWINRDTGLVDEWDMHLQGMKAEDPNLEVVFHDFRRVGGLLISTARELRNKNQMIRLANLKVSSDVPAGAFTK